MIRILFDKTNAHRLTITASGDIRIKIARGSSPEESDKIFDAFYDVAQRVIKYEMNKFTLRGSVAIYSRFNKITLYGNNKANRISFDY